MFVEHKIYGHIHWVWAKKLECLSSASFFRLISYLRVVENVNGQALLESIYVGTNIIQHLNKLVINLFQPVIWFVLNYKKQQGRIKTNYAKVVKTGIVSKFFFSKTFIFSSAKRRLFSSAPRFCIIKIFYGRNSFFTVVSYSVCHFYPSLIFFSKARSLIW